LRALAAHPERVAEIHGRYYREYLALWARSVEPAAGTSGGASAAADVRFSAPEWRELPFFRLLRDTYLLNARWLQELVGAAQLPAPAQRRFTFALRTDALRPRPPTRSAGLAHSRSAAGRGPAQPRPMHGAAACR
jgi:polyhydroxyalkanoate synthase